MVYEPDTTEAKRKAWSTWLSDDSEPPELEDALEWVKDNLDPGAVFDEQQLWGHSVEMGWASDDV